MIKLVANVESYDDHFVAWIENTRNIRGIVVEGKSAEEAMEELLVSLKVKIAYDLGIDIASITHQQFSSETDLEEFKKLKLMNGKAQKEINLSMSM